jgi:hypothetical protein
MPIRRPPVRKAIPSRSNHPPGYLTASEAASPNRRDKANLDEEVGSPQA